MCVTYPSLGLPRVCTTHNNHAAQQQGRADARSGRRGGGRTERATQGSIVLKHKLNQCAPSCSTAPPPSSLDVNARGGVPVALGMVVVRAGNWQNHCQCIVKAVVVVVDGGGSGGVVKVVHGGGGGGGGSSCGCLLEVELVVLGGSCRRGTNGCVGDKGAVHAQLLPALLLQLEQPDALVDRARGAALLVLLSVFGSVGAREKVAAVPAVVAVADAWDGGDARAKLDELVGHWAV